MGIWKVCEMKIRLLEDKDIPQVLEICREMREHHRRILGGYFKPIDEDYERSSLAKALDDENSSIYVAETEDGKIAGMVQAAFEVRPYLEQESFCHIGGLGVLPGYRWRGIAKALMDRVFEACRARKITEVTLGVFNRNTGAYKFYEDLGFLPLEQKMKLDLDME